MELSPVAKYIIHSLLRGYKKGNGVDLNDLEDIYDDNAEDLEQWVTAIKQLASISASDEADNEIKRLEHALEIMKRQAGGEK